MEFVNFFQKVRISLLPVIMIGKMYSPELFHMKEARSIQTRYLPDVIEYEERYCFKTKCGVESRMHILKSFAGAHSKSNFVSCGKRPSIERQRRVHWFCS